MKCNKIVFIRDVLRRYYPPIDTPEELYEAGIPWAATHDAWTYSIKGATEPYLIGLVSRYQTHDSDELIRLAKKGGYGFGVEIMATGESNHNIHAPRNGVRSERSELCNPSSYSRLVTHVPMS